MVFPLTPVKQFLPSRKAIIGDLSSNFEFKFNDFDDDNSSFGFSAIVSDTDFFIMGKNASFNSSAFSVPS